VSTVLEKTIPGGKLRLRGYWKRTSLEREHGSRAGIISVTEGRKGVAEKDHSKTHMWNVVGRTSFEVWVAGSKGGGKITRLHWSVGWERR